MTKALVLYYSTYGHIETMAVAEGVREAGAEAVIKRVPETVPEDIARSAYFKLDQAAPIATIEELTDYDAVIIGVCTRQPTENELIGARYQGRRIAGTAVKLTRA